MNFTEFLFLVNDQLRRPHELSRYGHRNLIQIIVRSYGLRHESWDVLQPDSDDMVLRVIGRAWQVDADCPDSDKLEEEGYELGTRQYQEAFNRRLPLYPTILESDFAIDARPILEELAKVKSIPIPSTFQGSSPTGAVMYEAIFGNLFSGCSLRWWDSGPMEWVVVTQAVFSIIKYIQRRSQTDSN